MSNSIPEIKQLVRRLVLDSADVQALVSGRVAGSHEVGGDTEAVYPRVVLEAMGGHAHQNGVMQQLRLGVYAFSKVSSDEAHAVYAAVAAALGDERLAHADIDAAGVAWEETRPVEDWVPASRAWCVGGMWVVHAA